MKNKLTILALFTFALLSYGMYQALAAAPTERTMGDAQRIFYIHVPSAWVAFMCFGLNFIASLAYLVRREGIIGQRSDALAVATAEVGIICCTVVLVTGPIWARKAWGVWWAWDLRLTTTLVLWLIYLAYLMLRRFSSEGGAPLMAAVLAVFSFADVPFVWFAIRFKNYRGNHPTPVMGKMHPAVAKAFFVNLLAFTFFGVLLIALRYTLERVRQQNSDRRLAHSFENATPELQEVTR